MLLAAGIFSPTIPILPCKERQNKAIKRGLTSYRTRAAMRCTRLAARGFGDSVVCHRECDGGVDIDVQAYRWKQWQGVVHIIHGDGVGVGGRRSELEELRRRNRFRCESREFATETGIEARAGFGFGFLVRSCFSS